MTQFLRFLQRQRLVVPSAMPREFHCCHLMSLWGSQFRYLHLQSISPGKGHQEFNGVFVSYWSPQFSCSYRFCNSCMIGKKVRVFWPVDDNWYDGIVHEYDPSSGEHLLRYEDGDSEWVRIGSGSVVSPDDSTMTPKNMSSQQHQQPPGSSDHGSYPPSLDEMSMARQPAQPGVYYAPSPQYHASPPPVMYYHPARSGHSINTPYHGGASPHDPHGMGGGAGEGEILSPSPADLHESSASPTGRIGKKGPKAWSKVEDATLLRIVQSMSMPMRWSVVAQSLPDRTGKQCRER